MFSAIWQVLDLTLEPLTYRQRTHVARGIPPGIQSVYGGIGLLVNSQVPGPLRIPASPHADAPALGARRVRPAPRARAGVSGFPFPVGRPPPGYTVSLAGVGLTTGCFVKGAVRSRSSLIHSGTIPARLAFAVNVPRTDEAQNARRSETSVTLSMLSSLIGTQDADGHAAAHGCTLLVVSLPSTSVSLVRLVDQRPSRRRRGTAYTTRW